MWGCLHRSQHPYCLQWSRWAAVVTSTRPVSAEFGSCPFQTPTGWPEIDGPRYSFSVSSPARAPQTITIHNAGSSQEAAYVWATATNKLTMLATSATT